VVNFTSGPRNPVLIEYAAGWAPKAVWTFSEKRKLPGLELRTAQSVVDYDIPPVSEEDTACIFGAEDGNSMYI
jgi:hypothetical protein